MAYTFADVVTAINGITTNVRERIALFYACGAESGCNPNAVQIGGGPGRGAWQIETTWLPEGEALNPYTAVTALYNKWNVAGCTSQQGQLWQTDQNRAALQAAMCIEKAPMSYNTAAQQRGQQAVRAGISGDDIVGGIVGIPGKSIISALGGVKNTAEFASKLFSFLTAPDFWIRALLIVGGMGIVLASVQTVLHVAVVPVPV